MRESTGGGWVQNDDMWRSTRSLIVTKPQSLIGARRLGLTVQTLRVLNRPADSLTRVHFHPPYISFCNSWRLHIFTDVLI